VSEVVPPLASSESSSSPRPPDFGRYRLLQRIGSGGMAEIFRAVAVGEQGFERTVAIKRIRQEVAELADIGKLFADEARVSALLDHPNIVQVYDFGAVEGTYYIAMEYLKGRNLEQVLSALRQRGERLAPSLAVLIARDVARGLGYAHNLADGRGRALRIVHRDVSPANIMLSQLGAVKLLDFGIARITSELRLAVTRGRALRGKCPYLAPEQITNEGEADARTDVFALGAVLWEMLTGRRLFMGTSDFEVLVNVLNREIPPPSALVPGLPAPIDEIVLTALSRDLSRRYQSAEELANALDEAIHLLPSRYGDLGTLVSGLPPQPTEELILPVSPPQGDGPRFELVLPSPPTPGVAAAGAGDLTCPGPAVSKTAPTKKVSAPDLMARWHRKPAAPVQLPRANRRRLLLGLGAVALLVVAEGLTSLAGRKPAVLVATRPASAAETVRARLPLPGPDLVVVEQLPPPAPAATGADISAPAPLPTTTAAAATVRTASRPVAAPVGKIWVKGKRARARSRMKSQTSRPVSASTARRAPDLGKLLQTWASTLDQTSASASPGAARR
jgi:serine/threonine protein kinase